MLFSQQELIFASIIAIVIVLLFVYISFGLSLRSKLTVAIVLLVCASIYILSDRYTLLQDGAIVSEEYSVGSRLDSLSPAEKNDYLLRMATLFEQELTVNPEDVDAWNKVITIYLLLGHLDRAYNSALLALDTFPDSSVLLRIAVRASREIEKGRITDKTKEHLEKLLQLSGDDFETLWHLAQANLERGDKESALTYFNRAKNLLNKDDPLYSELDSQGLGMLLLGK